MSNMYNLVHGVSPQTFTALPMLDKHPEEYPRYRDTFVSDVPSILVLCRIGDGDTFATEQRAMKDLPGFKDAWRASDDPSYMFFEYAVPERWRADFDLISQQKIGEVSLEYRAQMKKIYPKLAEKFETLWR